MKKFIISFLAIINIIFADINVTDSNQTKTKEDILKILNEENNNTELNEIIAQNIVESTKIEEDNNTKKLYMIVEEIKELNLKKEKLSENNATSEEIKDIKHEKDRLFDQIPLAITTQTLKLDNIAKFAERKKEINETIKKFQKKPGSNEFVNAKFEIQRGQISEIFYTALLKLEKKFKEGVNAKELESELNHAISELQKMEFDEFINLKTNIKDENLSNYEKKLAELKNTKATYNEILKYLLSNKDLLATNSVISALNLNSAISYINENIPFHIKGVNFGKIILVALITAFFYSLRRFLANLMFLFFKPLLKNKNMDEHTIKTQVVNVIKRPIGWLLLVYSIDLCLAIIFYPAPVPVKFGNLFAIIYIILFAWFVIEILDGYGIIILGSLAKKTAKKEVVNLIIKLLYIAIVLVAILLILRQLGFNISALLASLGIGGLAVALATKDIIANFFNSIMLLFDNSFSQGDWVVINGVDGMVVEIGLRKTSIRTFDNALIFVPNSSIITANIKNWSRRKVGREIKMNIGVEYSSSSKQLKKCVDEIRQMLIDHPDIATAKDSALNSKEGRLKRKHGVISVDDLEGYKNWTQVYLNEFADNSINILIWCFTKTVAYGEYLSVREDVLFKIMEIVEKNGLSFAFPSQSLYIEKMPEIGINDKNLAKGEKNG